MTDFVLKKHKIFNHKITLDPLYEQKNTETLLKISFFVFIYTQ